MSNQEDNKDQARRVDAPMHAKPKHSRNDVSFNYSGNIGTNANEKAGYAGAYATMTISFSHIDPSEVSKARNMFETKALELREQFNKSEATND
jgi:hypothetical protein